MSPTQFFEILARVGQIVGLGAIVYMVIKGIQWVLCNWPASKGKIGQ